MTWVFFRCTEHMTDKEINSVFAKAKFKRLLVRIPCAEKIQINFILRFQE